MLHLHPSIVCIEVCCGNEVPYHKTQIKEESFQGYLKVNLVFEKVKYPYEFLLLIDHGRIRLFLRKKVFGKAAKNYCNTEKWLYGHLAF